MLKIFYFILFLKLLNCDKNDHICKYSNDLNFISQSCPRGLTKIECKLDNWNLDSLLLSNLNDCYSHLSFENVSKINKHAFQSLTFKTNNTAINLKLNKVAEIDSYAFEYLKAPSQGINIQIENFFQKNTILNTKCFSLIQNLNSIEFNQFKELNISLDIFDDSYINTLSIHNSYLNKFNDNSKNLYIKNLIINNSFSQIWNDVFNSSYFNYESIAIINSGLDFLPMDFLSKFDKLKRLDLNSNSIKFINMTFEELNELNLEANPIKYLELISPKLEKLTLKRTLIENLNISQAFNLRELDLSESNLIKKYENINRLLDDLESFYLKNLRLIDLTYDYIGLNDNNFMIEYKYRGNCLWNKLESVFVKVYKLHECTCALFYLYRGFNLTINYLDQVPKCLAKLILSDELKFYEKKCAFNDEKVINCSEHTFTTSKIPSSELRTTELEELFVKKKIVSHYTIPVILSLFIICIVVILFFILKARNDYKNKFMNVYRNSITSDGIFEHKEMDEIVSVSSKSFAIRLIDTNSNYNI